MSAACIGIIGSIGLVVLILLGIPVAFAMLAVGLLGFSCVVSTGAGLNILAQDVFSSFSSYSLTVVPMFMIMGTISFASGASGRLFDSANKFFGHHRGGLSTATIGTCAAFAAMCGSANAASAALGKVALPEMEKYNYSPVLSSGCVACGGTLGVLIPPSTVFIIYGILTGTSIGKLFISGIVPGLLLTFLFMVVVYLLCLWDPEMGPAAQKVSWRERMASLGGIIEMLTLFILVMGGLFAGIFTPTEAGGVGAMGALIIALFRRQLTFSGFRIAVKETVQITCMMFTIIAGATVFGHFIAVTRIPIELSEALISMDLPRSVIMMLIILIYFIGGCFLDILALILLTVPIFFPVIVSLGFDPIWFGVIIVVISQIGAITPPVGICVYVIHGVKPDIPLKTIFKGCVPFLAAMIVCVGLLIIFPGLATFLPNLM